MRPMLWSLGALLLATAAMSGCLGGDDGIPDHVVATGTSPLTMTEYSYDGSNATASSGSIAVDVIESSASGSVVGNATVAGTAYEYQWTGFVGDPASPFQKDGISHDFYEHGDSGNGNTDIPSMHLISAGWGPVSLTAGGASVVDPLTGTPSLTGHFMLTDTGVWDDASGRVLKADGTTPYSPTTPGDALNVTDDLELHVQIKSDPTAPVHEDATNSESGSLGPAGQEASTSFDVSSTQARISVTVTVSAPADGVPVVPSQVNVTLADPAGSPVRSAELGGADQANSVTWEGITPLTAGSYTVSLVSQGAANWVVESVVDYPEPLFLYFVYEDVTWGDGSSG